MEVKFDTYGVSGRKTMIVISHFTNGGADNKTFVEICIGDDDHVDLTVAEARELSAALQMLVTNLPEGTNG